MAIKKRAKTPERGGALKTWLDANWESWLRPVLVIVVLALIALGYFGGLLSDLSTGVILAFGAIFGALIAGASFEAGRLPAERRRGLYGLVAGAGLALAYPAVTTLWPGAPLVEGRLAAKGDAVDLSALPGPGEYLVVAGGQISPSLAGVMEVDYTLEGRGESGAKSLLRGKISRREQQVKARRGVAGQAIKEHDLDKGVLALTPEAGLRLTQEIDFGSLSDGVHIAVYKRPLPWPLFVGLAGLFYLAALVYEIKSSPEKGKGYLAAAGGVSLVTAATFAALAAPVPPFGVVTELARHAFAAIMIGSVGGSLGGLILGGLLGRVVRRPEPPDGKRPARASED